MDTIQIVNANGTTTVKRMASKRYLTDDERMEEMLLDMDGHKPWGYAEFVKEAFAAVA